MPPSRNLIGKIFGRLTVISKNGPKNGSIYWNCLCICGNTSIVNSNTLNKGKSTSCGCYIREKNKLPPGEAQKRALYKSYQMNAKNNNRVFEINSEQFSTLVKGNCYYCDTLPSSIKKSFDKSMSLKWREESIFIYNGIDRIDNTKGYTTDNVVSCCGVCNVMKGSLTQEEFLNKVKKIHERHLNE